MEEIYKALDISLDEPLKADERVEMPDASTQSRSRGLEIFGYSRTVATSADNYPLSYDHKASERSEKKKKKAKKQGYKGVAEK